MLSPVQTATNIWFCHTERLNSVFRPSLLAAAMSELLTHYIAEAVACAGSQQLSVPWVNPGHTVQFFSSLTQPATLYNIDIIKLGMTWSSLCADCIMKLQTETQPVMCCVSQCHCAETLLASFIVIGWLVEAGRSSTTTVRWSSQILYTAKMIFRLSLILEPVSQCDEPRPKLSPNSLSSITVVIFQMGQLKIAQCGVGLRQIHTAIFHFVSVFHVAKSALSKYPNFRNQNKLLSWFL